MPSPVISVVETADKHYVEEHMDMEDANLFGMETLQEYPAAIAVHNYTLDTTVVRKKDECPVDFVRHTNNKNN